MEVCGVEDRILTGDEDVLCCDVVDDDGDVGLRDRAEKIDGDGVHEVSLSLLDGKVSLLGNCARPLQDLLEDFDPTLGLSSCLDFCGVNLAPRNFFGGGGMTRNRIKSFIISTHRNIYATQSRV